MPEVNFIAAIDDKYGIAIGQKLPWDLPTERKYFKDKIKDGPVVSGWNTFAAHDFKPYGNGVNFVITRREAQAIPGVWVIHDLHNYFKNLQEDIWVAGGGQIFEQALPYATKMYITRIKGDYDADIFFPKFEDKFHRIDQNLPQTENGITFTFEVWELNT